jgi:3-mercaptopyruvate sulfurtransferase SseA
MATLVTAPWVEQHIDDPHILLLDPRRPMRYLQGHLKHAVNLPVYKAFDADGKLRLMRNCSVGSALLVWMTRQPQ